MIFRCCNRTALLPRPLHAIGSLVRSDVSRAFIEEGTAIAIDAGSPRQTLQRTSAAAEVRRSHDKKGDRITPFDTVIRLHPFRNPRAALARMLANIQSGIVRLKCQRGSDYWSQPGPVCRA